MINPRPDRAPWRPPPPHPALPAHELHLWLLDLRSVDSTRPFESVLDPRERARADRFRVERGRHRYVLVRGSVRLILSRYLGVPAAEIGLEEGAHGRPTLTGRQRADGTDFNVSHSGEWALLGVRRGPVGVDIELLRRVPERERIADRHFTPRERELWRRSALDDRDAVFFAIWTRKEAMLKAAGVGLAVPLRDVDTRECRLPPDLGRERLWVRDLAPRPDLAGAVAGSTPPAAVRRFCWPLADAGIADVSRGAEWRGRR